jgi:hypothetical protein
VKNYCGEVRNVYGDKCKTLVLNPGDKCPCHSPEAIAAARDLAIRQKAVLFLRADEDARELLRVRDLADRAAVELRSAEAAIEAAKEELERATEEDASLGDLAMARKMLRDDDPHSAPRVAQALALIELARESRLHRSSEKGNR